MKETISKGAFSATKAVAALSLLLSACSPQNSNGSDWVTVGMSSDETRYSPLEEINRDTVSRLGLAWSLDLPNENSLEGTPLEVEGVIYFAGGVGMLYAVSVDTGEILWTYDPKAGERMTSRRGTLPVNRGIAYEDGTLFVATRDGRMVAVDSRSGKLKWESEFLIPEDETGSTGAPRVCGSNVMIGNAGSESGTRGYVTAMNRDTGKFTWRFFIVPGDPAVDKDETTQMVSDTWDDNGWRQAHGGGNPWNGMTCDEELGQFLIGAGNAAPYPGETRSTIIESNKTKENLFTASLVAVDTETGKYRWHYQHNPNETWDWKSVGNISLADMEYGGKMHKVALQAPSNGFFYVVDRETGKLLAAEAYAKQTWADGIDLETGRPIEKPGIRYNSTDGKELTIWPGPLGAHNWQDMSVDTDQQIAYIPYIQAGGKYSTNKRMIEGFGAVKAANAPYVDPSDPLDGKGQLVAWNIPEQKIAWSAVHPSIWNGGTMVTKGGLVFQGLETGELVAYNSTTGEKLWSFDAKLGIMAPPITYEHKGKQYVSVLVGYGGGGGWGAPELREKAWKAKEQPRRLLTFVLDGTEKLPATPERTGIDSAVPIQVEGFAIDPAKAARGQRVVFNCAACHELGEGSSMAPDLRASPIAADLMALQTLLHEGFLAESGMPPFPELTDHQIEDLYHYIRQIARDKAIADARGSQLNINVPKGVSQGH